VLANPRNAGNVPEGMIGIFTRYGIIEGNFWGDPGRTIDVEHMMGCNMSFRREVVARLGGFREFLKGISGIGEDTEMCVRVRRLGFRIRFEPRAVVDHIGAPQSKGRRFDARYAFFAGRNYNMLLLRNFGLAAAMPWRYVVYSNGRSILRLLKHPRDVDRAAAFLAGSAVGWSIAIGMLLRQGIDPVRHDPAGEQIRQWLSRRPAPQTGKGDRGDAQLAGCQTAASPSLS
jgi:GT2 family glycosyltransferase